jgi:hypothetical protein
MRQTHMSLNRSLLFIVIVTSEMGHLLDLYKAQQQLLETTGATLSDEGSYPPARARSTLTVDLLISFPKVVDRTSIMSREWIQLVPSVILRT